MTHHILKSESKLLQNLFQKLAELQELDRIFASHVEGPIVAHCKVANLLNNCLIVIVDSGNWATQLRFHIPDLIIKLRQHPRLSDLKAICCKTRPKDSLNRIFQKKSAKAMERISEHTSHIIQQSANTITDEKLRKILERIAKRM